MHGLKHCRPKRHRGAVLAAVLLLGFTAVSTASIVFAIASAFWNDAEALFVSVSRENTAEEAMALSQYWFEREMRMWTVTEVDQLFVRQKYEIPEAVLAPLRAAHSEVDIAAVLIDQDYAPAFGTEAIALDLAQGKRSRITVPQGEGEADVVCIALRFELRVTVTEKTFPNRKNVLRKGLIALYKEHDSYCFVIDPSYIKKR